MIRKLDHSTPEFCKTTHAESRSAGLKVGDWRWSFIVSLAAGGLIGAAWVWSSLGWLGLFGIALFLGSQWEMGAAVWRRFLLGWVTGGMAYGIACSWLPYSVCYLLECGSFAGVSISLAIWAYLGFQFALVAFLFALANRYFSASWLLLPPIWLTVVAWVPSLFPASPACLLADYPAFLQLASIGGVYLVSVYVLCIALLLSWMIWGGVQYAKRGAFNGGQVAIGVAVALLLFAVYVWGDLRVRAQHERTDSGTAAKIRVGLVQAETHYNISHDRFVETSQSMAGQVDLIVWPEASLGNYSTLLTEFRDEEEVKAHSIGDDTRYRPFPNPVAPLLAGADMWSPDDKGEPDQRFVSALLLDNSEVLVGRRDKKKLMPFGEFIPGEALFPGLARLFDSPYSITAGQSDEAIGEVNGVAIGALICCEDMHPELSRESVQAGADLLVTIGNGMVFNSETVARQHYRIAKFRAIENGRPMLRCTTNGVSVLLNSVGEESFALPVGKDAAGIVEVAVEPSGMTLYTQLGRSVPIAVCFSMIFVAWVWQVRTNKSTRFRA